MTLLLQGCLSPVKTPTISNYILNEVNTNTVQAKRTSKILLVSPPQAAPGYDSRDMVYIKKLYQLEKFAKNRWADEPTKMLQPLIIQSLQNTRHFHAVVSAPFSGLYDLRLDSKLLQLQQEFLSTQSLVRLKIYMQLVDATTLKVINSRNFVIVVPATEANPYAGVLATNCAVKKFLQQLDVFVVENT